MESFATMKENVELPWECTNVTGRIGLRHGPGMVYKKIPLS